MPAKYWREFHILSTVAPNLQLTARKTSRQLTGLMYWDMICLICLVLSGRIQRTLGRVFEQARSSNLREQHSGVLCSPSFHSHKPSPPLSSLQGQRALGFVLSNKGMIDKTLLFDIGECSQCLAQLSGGCPNDSTPEFMSLRDVSKLRTLRFH